MVKLKNFLAFSVIFLLAISTATGQEKLLSLPFDSITNKITYSQIVLLDSSAKQTELFVKAREWFSKTYKSSQDVIQMDDKESGIIIGKALLNVYYKTLGITFNSGYINYTIKFSVKDGKYKYEISDFYHTGGYINGHKQPDGGPCEKLFQNKKGVNGNSYERTYEKYLIEMDDEIKDLIYDLKLSMASKLNLEDW